MVNPAILLLAEDDPDMAFLVCTEFRKLAPDWEVCHAVNGHSAMQRLSMGPLPTILMTDLHMPVMNGFELIEWARRKENLSSLYILVYSSSDKLEDQRRCEDLHSDGFIKKSISLNELRDRLRKVIRLGEESVQLA